MAAFFAEPLTRERAAEIATRAPENPFATPNYAAAREVHGEQAWAFGLRDQGALSAGCVGFLHHGRVTRSLEIPSLPGVDRDSVFWPELLSAARRLRVTDLRLGSYASSRADIPVLPNTTERGTRAEWVLDLTVDWAGRIGSNHKRNISRARKSGVTVRRTRSAEACARHAELMSTSMLRRADRGEDVPAVVEDLLARALLASGAGELFQAVGEGQVLSSVLVLHAAEGAYYQSAGTSPDGMQIGASPLLIAETAELLRFDGRVTFNLGGAGPESSGLQRFKSGFGARVVPLAAASCSPAAPWRRGLRDAARFVRAALR